MPLGELESTFERRWRNILEVAVEQGHRRLILGAWGCGAFRNDPDVVATIAARVVRDARWRGVFDRVVFAIPEHGKRSLANLEAFRRALASVA